MNIGSVFFDKKFAFHDGETGEKLFVVLGSDNGTYIVAKTTSQQHGRGVSYGCQPDDRFHNFYLPRNSCYLKACTWVCLDEFYEFGVAEVLQKRFSGTVNPVCELSSEITRQIQDCALQSLDITQNQEKIIQNCLIDV